VTFDTEENPFHQRRCNGCGIGRIVRGKTPTVRSGRVMFPVDMQNREFRYSCCCVEDPIERFDQWEPIHEGADENGRVLFTKSAATPLRQVTPPP